MTESGPPARSTFVLSWDSQTLLTRLTCNNLYRELRTTRWMDGGRERRKEEGGGNRTLINLCQPLSLTLSCFPVWDYTSSFFIWKSCRPFDRPSGGAHIRSKSSPITAAASACVSTAAAGTRAGPLERERAERLKTQCAK